MIARMFDGLSGGGSSPEVLAHFDEMFERCYPSVTAQSAALIDRICASARAENQAAAAQLVAIGELFGYRLSRCGETEQWAVDTEAALSAELGAALRISQGLAASQLRYARALRERLPRTGAVFIAGDINYLVFRMIVYRTDLITDAAVLAAVDAQLAVGVGRWPSMSKARLGAQVDKIVATADADALRRRNEQHDERAIVIEDRLEGGISEIHGQLATPDARALDQRLNALAATVCAHDPRTRAQRRADALGAVAANATALGCRCGRPDCAAGKHPGASPVVIHVITDQATLDGTSTAPASLLGADGLISPELVAELAASATLVPLIHPRDAPPEPRYTPSKALADFVRCRDLTCRWPGCDQPATNCDVDHTIPYASGGPTHASNLKCYCRTHHLVKTFYGWGEQQLADGTLILTSPTGHTYVTTPGSALLFPALCAPTAQLTLPDTDPTPSYCAQRTAMMPQRRRTRAQDRAYRIATERRHNHQARTTTHTTHRADPDNYFGLPPPNPDDEPPPF